MSDRDDVTREPAGISRRTLVRTGAHAAWMVPALTVLTTAPAYAAGSGTGAGVLSLANPTASWQTGSSGHIKAGITVRALGTGSVSFNLTISFGSAAGSVTGPGTVSGWTFVSSTGSSFTYTGSLTGSSTAPGSTLVFPSPTFAASDTSHPTTVVTFTVTTATTGWTVDTTDGNKSPQQATAN